MIFLLVAGIGAVAAGLLAILFGIPIKEFGFGSTVILSGVVGLCTGLLMLSLWIVAREFKALVSRAAAPGSGATKPQQSRDRVLPPLPADSTGDPRRNEPAIGTSADTKPMPISVSDLPAPGSPPWQDDPTRERGREPEPVAAPEPEPKPAEPKRRNLLFSSMSRKERERKGEGAAPDAPADPGAPRNTFDDAWPERARADAPRRPRPSAFDKAGEGAQPPDGPAAVTVLKSGVVDGMAYSLYSDGSIEAQLPEGMMRFASIDELRAHLEQRP